MSCFPELVPVALLMPNFLFNETSDTNYRLPAGTEVMLYRITQELVSNSLKHANAKQIDLLMLEKTDNIVLIYKDNGQGFNYDQARKKAAGLGIGNIESRVAILGGRITWQTKTDQGVQAIIEIPISTPSKSRSSKSPTNLPQSG